MQILIITIVLICHFIGDFVLQTNEMAQNKSKSNKVLTSHVRMYIAPFLFMAICFPIAIHGLGSIYFLIVNFIMHWVIDHTSSRVTSYYWEKKKIHAFFVTIGADQLIHALTLLITIQLFLV